MEVVFAAAIAVMLGSIYRMVTDSLKDVDVVQTKKQAIVRKGQYCSLEAEASEARTVGIEARIAERQKELQELQREAQSLAKDVQEQEARHQGRNPTRHKLSTV